MIQIDTSDKMVSYDTFMDDLAARVAERLNAIRQQPEVISQRAAYRQFGRANVDRWHRAGKLHPCYRIGKVEYSTAELREQQRQTQDYFVH